MLQAPLGARSLSTAHYAAEAEESVSTFFTTFIPPLSSLSAYQPKSDKTLLLWCNKVLYSQPMCARLDIVIRDDTPCPPSFHHCLVPRIGISFPASYSKQPALTSC